ncbi:MAG: EthD family reductase [Acidimicrobiia bacterium]
MIRVSVFYPASDDATFDHDYYRDHHVPLCLRTWGLDRAEIDKGVNGPNVAAVHFFFDSMDQFGAAMGSPDTAAVMADVVNYTNIQPALQVSEIVA